MGVLPSVNRDNLWRPGEREEGGCAGVGGEGSLRCVETIGRGLSERKRRRVMLGRGGRGYTFFGA